MRIPRSLAWFLLAVTFLTAGLLRQFHDQTPHSPFMPAMVGSLLFAAVFVLLLVAAREWRLGAVGGTGVRLGTILPILLMLMMEKWISITLYNPVFYLLASPRAPEPLVDAWYRAFAGAGLLAVCLLVGALSRPTARTVWRRARPSRWPGAAAATATAVLGAYAILGGTAAVLGGTLRLQWPRLGPLLFWILAGQALRAFAEEVYYRGLLLSEMERIAPRLGLRSAAARRWAALLPTALLFGMEHLWIAEQTNRMVREFIFAAALGLLFGMLVMVSTNIHFAAGVHTWINWLLLGAAPRFVQPDGSPALPAGTYVALGLIFSFVLAFVVQRRRRTT